MINGVYHDEAASIDKPVQRPDGTPITVPDEPRDKAIHVRGPRGEPLSARSSGLRFIEPPSVIMITLKVLEALGV